jgi:hypothetical protein
LQEAIGKPAGRSADVQRRRAAHLDRKCGQCVIELLTSAADEPASLLDRDPGPARDALSRLGRRAPFNADAPFEDEAARLRSRYAGPICNCIIEAPGNGSPARAWQPPAA